MVGPGLDKEVEPSGLCDGLNMGSESREKDWRWFLGAETEHLGEWGRWREKGKARVLFGACHLCDEWPCFQERILPFTVELLFPLLCWETFSLRFLGWGHQWCNGEVPPGDVSLALCSHLSLSWLWLLTPLVGIRGLDLRAPRDRHPPASGLGIVLCAPFTPAIKLTCYSRASNSEKAMALHSSTLAWKIPWMEEPGGLQSIGSLRVGHNWATSLSLFTFMRWRRKWQPTPVFLPGESQGRGTLVGCHLWDRTESDTTEAT